eukprot:TRINITY_DN25421_c0_g1_i2.p1 TRINITY_DN25421_c0_g1~~TRINITY_DN25421_c0_g1_i2.p1  ORF type:complete len:251 (-),score=19.42 TRINITY_DN25421_c0_g1_i2:149-850(-)
MASNVEKRYRWRCSEPRRFSMLVLAACLAIFLANLEAQKAWSVYLPSRAQNALISNNLVRVASRTALRRLHRSAPRAAKAEEEEDDPRHRPIKGVTRLHEGDDQWPDWNPTEHRFGGRKPNFLTLPATFEAVVPLRIHSAPSLDADLIPGRIVQRGTVFSVEEAIQLPDFKGQDCYFLKPMRAFYKKGIPDRRPEDYGDGGWICNLETNKDHPMYLKFRISKRNLGGKVGGRK